MTDVSPILHTRIMSCAPMAAFDISTRRIGEWWHSTYTANAEIFQAVMDISHWGWSDANVGYRAK